MAPAASSILANSRPFSDTPRFTRRSSEHLAHGPQPILRGRPQRDREVGLLDAGAGALEVVAGGQLTLRLVDGVADFLVVHFGHDVERRHGRDATRPLLSTGFGSVPEWPKGADCKSAGSAFGGSNPPRPTSTNAVPDSTETATIPRASRGMGLRWRSMAYVRTRRAADGTPRYECCWRDRATNQERSKTFRRKADAERQAKLVEADSLRGVAVPSPSRRQPQGR